MFLRKYEIQNNENNFILQSRSLDLKIEKAKSSHRTKNFLPLHHFLLRFTFISRAITGWEGLLGEFELSTPHFSQAVYISWAAGVCRQAGESEPTQVCDQQRIYSARRASP